MAEGIEKRASRGNPVYRAVVYDRRSGRKVSRTFATLAQARSWRTRMQELSRRGFSLAGTPETVREAAEAFIEGLRSGAIRTRQGVAYKPSVIRAYESSLRNHVLPDLGGKKLAKLERRDVQALVERLTEQVGPSAVRNAVKPLQTICRRAVEDGDLAISPCERLRLPAAPDRRERIASPAEAASLIAALGQQDRALWACAFYAGLRMGEIRALRWDDIDHAAGVIRVERAMDNSGVVITPKSRAGRRRVPIVRQLWDELVLHQLATNRDRGLVFGTTPVSAFTPSAVNRRAQNAWLDAGLNPIGLHEARHTYASLMIAAGANAKTISAYMGHSSIQVTFDRYGHLMPETRPKRPPCSRHI